MRTGTKISEQKVCVDHPKTESTQQEHGIKMRKEWENEEEEEDEEAK